jgi:hypothetical protein
MWEAGGGCAAPSEWRRYSARSARLDSLMAASSKGHTDIVELLLAHGCGDVDAQGLAGRVALHYACLNGRAGVVRALLGAGADPHAMDHDGHMPEGGAVGVDRGGCVALLQVISLCC